MVLGVEPAEVGVIDLPDLIGVTGEVAVCGGAQQPFGGEEGHLGIIGDGATATESQIVVGEARRAVDVTNSIDRFELDRCPKRVANRSSKEAAGKPVEEMIIAGRHYRQSSPLSLNLCFKALSDQSTIKNPLKQVTKQVSLGGTRALWDW
jgi:hypothetical protein